MQEFLSIPSSKYTNKKKKEIMDAGQVFYVEFSFRKAKDESMKKNAPLELEPDSLADNREYCKIFWSTTRA